MKQLLMREKTTKYYLVKELLLKNKNKQKCVLTPLVTFSWFLKHVGLEGLNR